MFSRQPPPGSGLHQCPLCHDDCVVPVEAQIFIAAFEHDVIDASDFAGG